MNPTKYILNTNEIASASNKRMFDLFNAVGSGVSVLVHSLQIVAKTDVAVTGVVSPRYDIYRTSDIGTSGTSVAYAPSTASTAGIIPFDTNQPGLPSGVTARVAPAGGATAANWICAGYPFSEETNAATYWVRNILPGEGTPIVLNPGQGLSAVQGSVASVNSYIFIVTFGVKEN